MTLEPDAAALVARIAELQLPRYETLSPAAARQAMTAARLAQNISPVPTGSVENLSIPVREGSRDARLYRPVKETGPLPVLLYLHGGGWVIGDLDSHDDLCRRLANASGCVLVSIDYRLAPEHKFPAAIDDATDGLCWLAEHAAELDIDAVRLAVGGDSAGANLAAVLALTARDGDLPAIAYQLLIYPTLDLKFAYPSHALDEANLPLLSSTMAWFRGHYLESTDQIADWRASPLSASSFAGLPPAYILTAGYDPLADEGQAYADRLRDAGVETTYRNFPGQVHGFLSIGSAFSATETAIGEIGAALRAALHG